MERDPSSPGARSPYLVEARSGFSEGERAAEGRGCFWRGTLNADRKAHRKEASVRTQRLKGADDCKCSPRQPRLAAVPNPAGR
jgi:hypothetical protein